MKDIIKNFEFLWWVEQCFLFRDDLREQLKEIGFPEEIIFAFCFSDAVCKNKSIINLFGGCGRAYPEYFELFIKDCYRKYEKVKDFSEFTG